MKLIECNNGDFIWVQIKADETLQDIVTRHSTTINNIIRHNPNIDLYEGEMIKILNKANIYHVVKPMETLTLIAKKYKVNEEDLIRQNNLKSTRLFIGQNLKINNKNN